MTSHLTKAVGIIKQGLHEVPDLYVTFLVTASGLTFGGVAIYMYDKQEKYKRRFRDRYTVFRPDDPRVKNIRH
ncbi:Uncharacterised protein g3417 [Pycnogonum litorale]